MRSSRGSLLRALRKGGYLKIKCKNIEELYQQLAEIALNSMDNMSKTEILESLGAQSKTPPVFMGHGISILNIYNAKPEQRICFVISLYESLQIPDKDEQIDCVFFLLSPLDDIEGHLATLSDISKFCRSVHRRKQIKDAETVEDVIAAII